MDCVLIEEGRLFVMKRGNAILVLPKLDSYNRKNFESKLFLEGRIREYVRYIKELGKKVYCFAQDMLAVELLSQDPEIIWLSVIGDSDDYFVKNSKVIDVPKAYSQLSVVPMKGETMAEAVKRYKAIRLSDFCDPVEYEKARIVVLNKRVRYVCNRVLSNIATFIIYLDAKNNFCNLPTLNIGDEKWVIKDELLNNTVVYIYSGVPVDRDMFNKIMEEERKRRENLQFSN